MTRLRLATPRPIRPPVDPTSQAPGRSWPARAILVLNLTLAVSYVGLWSLMAWRGMLWRADFTNFYTGWSIVLAGDGQRLYDLEFQARVQQQILAGRSFAEGLLPYVNPPHLTLPFVPLAGLPLTVAFGVWSLGQMALLVWLAWLLLDIARAWERRERLLLLSALLAFPPLFNTALLGAFSLLMLVCLVQFYRALKRGREAHAGLWLLLGTIKFQHVLLPGLMLVAARRWRALAAALLAGGLLAGLASLAFGWRVWLDYATVLREATGYYDRYGFVPTNMYNLRGTLTLWLGNEHGPLINHLSTLGLALAALAMLLLWRGPWRPESPDFEPRVGLTMLIGLLASPHLYPHDSLMLVAPATLGYAYARRQRGAARWCGAFLLGCPPLFLAAEYTIGGGLGVRLPVALMVALAIWMGKALLDERRRASSDGAGGGADRRGGSGAPSRVLGRSCNSCREN
jgi:glycosyl transferase family 87